MAMETVERVRRAEAEADRIEQEAKMEAAQIQAAAETGSGIFTRRPALPQNS